MIAQHGDGVSRALAAVLWRSRRAAAPVRVRVRVVRVRVRRGVGLGPRWKHEGGSE